jgi:GWxTD domain-containing protein
MKKPIPGVLLTLLVFGSAFGAGLSKKYRAWDRSPEAYFLTNAERDQWRKVKTDADAQNFVLDYKAKRGPDFEKMIAERIAVADKYFSSGETRGSETLRGRVVIVFGPPSSIEREASPKNSARADVAAIQAAAGGNGRDAQPTISSSGTASPASPHAAAAQTPMFTFVYDAEHAPKASGKAFRAELKMYSETDQEPEDPQGLDQKFEAMAQASILPPESTNPK